MCTSASFLPVVRVAPVILLLFTMACTPTNQGDEGGYSTYLKEKELQKLPVNSAPSGSFQAGDISAAIDRSQAGSRGIGLAPPSSGSDYVVMGPVTMDEMPAPSDNNPAIGLPISSAGISDEQDFVMVSERETIESDRQRIEQNRAAYIVFKPEDLPSRPGEMGVNIIDYALATNHPVGVVLYSRWKVGYGSYESKCAAYYSSDLAQDAFLKAGGPERDKLALDPDGDGYACGWDPSPYRL